MSRKNKITLILGGARSGKSSYAQSLAEASGRPVTFVATAQALDGEMSKRIQKHRAERPAGWETLEIPCDLLRVVNKSGVVFRVNIEDFFIRLHWHDRIRYSILLDMKDEMGMYDGVASKLVNLVQGLRVHLADAAIHMCLLYHHRDSRHQEENCICFACKALVRWAQSTLSCS